MPMARIQDLVDAAQIGAAEGRQAVEEEFVHGAALIDAAGLDVAARAGALVLGFVRHPLEHSRSRTNDRLSGGDAELVRRSIE